MKQFINNFRYFYSYIRYRMYVMLIFSLLVGIMDGFGLAMFIPLLELVSNESGSFDPDKMGNLSFLIEFLQNLGIQMTLRSILLVMLLFFVIKGIFLFLEQYLSLRYRQQFIKLIRLENIYGLADSTYEFYTALDSGKAQNTLSGEVNQVMGAFTAFVRFLNQGILLFIYLILAFLANANFAILVILGALIINFLIKRIFVITKDLSVKRTQFGHKYQLLLIQFVDKFKYLKATGQTRTYASKMDELIHNIEETNTKSGSISALFVALREPLLLSIVVMAIFIQITFFSVNIGVILLSLLLFYRALTAALIIQTNWNEYLSFAGSLENMRDFTQTLAMAKEQEGLQKFRSFEKEIQLKQLGFTYGDRMVLAEINLTIKKNEVVAFIGESGSGKTTLMNIICGLIQPKQGQMFIDGIDSREIYQPSYQKRIGYITQEPVIFNDSVFNNVSFWADPTAENYKKAEEALQLARMDTFVSTLSHGMDTLLGINGITLSGGQKQRVAIARELYKDVDILCMDEATSALDEETENALQENIRMLKGKFTIIIIAHRLSTIKMADRIYSLAHGKISSEGTYEDFAQNKL